jgi:hypothetical protein
MAKKAKAARKTKKAGAKNTKAKKSAPSKAGASRKGRRTVAAKVAKQTKVPSRKRTSAAKLRRKAAAPPKPKAVAATPVANNQPASAATATPPAHESLAHRIGGAFKAVVDTLTDAEQLHHRLDPDASRDPDPE